MPDENAGVGPEGRDLLGRLQSALQRSLDVRIPSDCEERGEDYLLRSRLLVSLCFTFSFLMLGASIAFMRDAGPGAPWVTTALGAGLFLVCPWIFRATGSLKIACSSMLTVLFTVLAISSMRNGGFGLPTTYFVGVLPLAGILIAGLRTGAIWFLISIGSLSGLRHLHAQGFGFPAVPGPGEAIEIQFHGAVLLVLCLSAEAALYRWLNTRAVRSLTERNRALEVTAQSLSASQAQTEAILESTGDGIVGIDLAGLVVFASVASARLLGRDETDLIGCDLYATARPSHRDGTSLARGDCAFLTTLSDGEARAVTDEVFVQKDGSLFPVEYLCTPIHDRRDRVVGAVVTFRGPGERALVAELGEIVNQSLNETYVFDIKSWKVIYANRGALANLQYDMAELSELTPLDLKTDIARPDFARLLAPLLDLKVDSVSFSSSHRRKDGTRYPVDAQVQMSTFQSKRVFLANVLDTTERKALEAQLAQSQRLESIGQLAAGVAHEINTPIQFVGDNIHFLEESFGDLVRLEKSYAAFVNQARVGRVTPDLIAEVDQAAVTTDRDFLMEEIPRAISQSREGVQRVSKIVAAMKAFAHPGGGDSMTSSNLNAAIESTILVAASEWKYVANVETRFAVDLPAVPCLLQEFNQVILILLVNAAHAIAAGGGSDSEKGTITVSTEHADGFAVIRVTDTGSGIPEAVRGRIFDPFFTTKEVGKGTGQGLSIAHAVIVERHAGTLTFETEVGQGTSFIVRIPLGDDQ